jgi:hypothetical protein
VHRETPDCKSFRTLIQTLDSVVLKVNGKDEAGKINTRFLFGVLRQTKTPGLASGRSVKTKKPNNERISA